MVWLPKWLIILVALLAMLYGGARLYGEFVVNPNAIEELRTNPQGERAGIVMLMTLPDGKMLPVNYLREGDIVYVGADGPWWRSFRDGGAKIVLEIRGEQLTGQAQVVLDDPEYTRDVFKRLRPNVPKWLPDWLNAKLVVVTLGST